MNLGQAMKLMRTASGLRQKEIASRLGVTSNYVSLIENGKRDPSISFLRTLARILNVPVGLFFLWDETGADSSKRGLDQLRDILARLETMYLFTSRQRVRKGRVA